jgi:hypothetical protein
MSDKNQSVNSKGMIIALIGFSICFAAGMLGAVLGDLPILYLVLKFGIAVTVAGLIYHFILLARSI